MDVQKLLVVAMGVLVVCIIILAKGFRQPKLTSKPSGIPNPAASGSEPAKPPSVVLTAPQSLVSDFGDERSVDCPICGKPVPISLIAHTECRNALANAKSDIEAV